MFKKILIRSYALLSIIFVTVVCMFAFSEKNVYAHSIGMDSSYYSMSFYGGTLFFKDGVVAGASAGTTSDYGSGTVSGAVVIPSTINGQKVTAIGKNAFESCLAVTSVTIPEGVTVIEEGAFATATHMTSITIPSTLTTMGDLVFSGCKALTSIELPDSLTSLGTQVFNGCSALKTAVIKGNITTLSDGTFMGCTALTSVTLPQKIKTLGSQAFYRCSGLTSITLPSAVTTIKNNCFESCSKLTSIDLTNITSMEKEAFKSCVKLASFTLGTGLTTIPASCFTGCTSLTSIDLKSVKSVGNSAFNGCTALKTVNIPASTTVLGTNVFYKCSSITEINVDSANTVYASYDGALYDKSFDTLYTFPSAKSGSVTLASGIHTIAANAFYNAKNLEEITIPGTITTIQSSAFTGCTQLKKIYIGKNTSRNTSIESYAFYGIGGNSGIDIYIPETVTLVEPIIRGNSDVRVHTVSGSTATDTKYYEVYEDYGNVYIYTDYTSAQTEVTYAQGDVDRNGTVDKKDCAYILKYINGRTVFDSEQKKLADCNSDGNINLKDAIYTVK